MGSILAGITIVFATAWCASALLRRGSAASRHVIWTCAFAAVLLLAPLRWRLPQRAIASPLPAVATVTTISVTPGPKESNTDPTTILVTLWALGAIVMALRLLRNAIQLRSIVRNARGSSPILTSSRIKGPLVAGLFRPV